MVAIYEWIMALRMRVAIAAAVRAQNVGSEATSTLALAPRTPFNAGPHWVFVAFDGAYFGATDCWDVTRIRYLIVLQDGREMRASVRCRIHFADAPSGAWFPPEEVRS